MTQTSMRTMWISDLHLGNKDCKAHYLLDFLNKHTAETIILVGDVIDFHAMKTSRHWPDSHGQIVSVLLERAHQGCRLIYIPGNHDASVREYLNFDFGKVEVKPRYEHVSASGKRIVAVHGDEFDNAVCHSRLTEIAGYVGYDFLLFLNRWCALLRRKIGMSYWSLASYIKTKVRSANVAISRFEVAAVQFARRKGADAIVCGHIHHPDIKSVGGTLYLNDGDWIENCTSLVEHHDGNLQLLRWTEHPCVLQETDVFALSPADSHTEQQEDNAAA